MRKKIFRTAFFGFNRKDVYSYLDAISEEIAEKVSKKEQEALTLSTENRKLREEYSDICKRCNEYYNERDKIVRAIVRAEESAELIIANVNRETELKRLELQQEIERERRLLQKSIDAEIEKMRVLRREINELRYAAGGAVKRFEREIASLDKLG